MDTVLDMIPAGESALPLKADNAAPVDLLGRQEIVDRIMKILEVISEKRSSCTFALNGAWGTGKTFVLNMLMNQLWEYHSDKYIVFHYNCWQYDYYEEPLIAIVAAMLDSVDEENHLLPANLRDKAKAGMEIAKPVLKKIATDFVKNKIGVDLTDVVSSVTEYQEALDSEEQKKAESRSFDEFYSFKRAIGQAQEEIQKVAQNHTLVIVVDELDRCLPAYAIKVLERLHHLFSGLANTAVILAVDKAQLDATITQIFGTNTDTTRYLHKFINFEMELATGSVLSGFREKHRDYFDLFDESLIETDFPYDQFLSALFSGIDIRSQEQLINRIKTVHMMVFPGEKKDYSVMCCELLWIVYRELYGGCTVTAPIPSSWGDCASITSQENPYAIDYVNKKLDSFLHKHWHRRFVTVELYSQGRLINYTMSGSGVIQKLLLFYISHLESSGKIRYFLSTADAVRASSDFCTIAAAEDDQNIRSCNYEDNLQGLNRLVDLLNLIH